LKFKRPPQLWRYTGLLERCVASVDAFVSPSLFTQKMHHQRGFIPPMTVVPHFVPESGPEATSTGLSPHPRPYFLYVGRLEKIKGVDTLLADLRGYEHADLLIAGSGTQDAELRRQAQGMANVRFLGPLPPEQLRDFYRHAIALLVPSAGYEVLGLVILEAYLRRTPVIARDLGAFTEVVEQSKGGFLYRTGDELRTAMERLRNDPPLRQKMGELGYQAYREKWTEDAHLEAYFQLLDDTARRKLGYAPWHASACLPGQFEAALQSE
jgi:glycosyltransferase involved in cell wall biosynthesis